MVFLRIRLLLPALLLAGVTACSSTGDPEDPSNSTTVPGGPSETTDAGEASDVTIQVRDNSFAPESAEVHAGMTGRITVTS